MRAATTTARRLALTLATVLVACVAVLAGAAAAQAEEGAFGVVPGSFSASLSSDQAGGHPDVTVRFTVRHRVMDPSDPDYLGTSYKAYGVTRDVVVDLPPGLLGDPSAAPRCKALQWPACPLETQIGTVRLKTALVDEMWAPVYNVEPSHGAPAEFGFMAAGLLAVRLQISVRPDGGLRTTIDNLPSIAPLVENELTFWGVPADAANDDERGRSCMFFFGTTVCDDEGDHPSSEPRKPFMSNATVCGPQRPVRLRLTRYGGSETAEEQAPLPALAGCDQLSFGGTATVQADSPAAGAPSGYRVELKVPQSSDPDGLATPQLKQAVVRLPLGTVVSPAVADGLQTCTEEQFAFGQDAPARCPAGSKIGAVSIDSPLLTQPLTGAVFLAAQTPQQLLRLVLVVEAQGVRLKLPGRIDADPVTGQLTATFDQNPQLPFRSLTMTLKGGPRAVLSNPRQCGPATSTAQLTPYGGGAAASSTDTFAVSGDGAGAPCPAASFTPALSAGSASTAAGAASPFTLTFARDDADDLLKAVDVTLPPGVMPKIASVAALCGEAQAAAGGCDEGSRIGSATVLAGPGGQPYALPGRVYVGGPYKGAPYSLSIVVPAQAGPFDLGTVVVRAAVFVDLHTAALRIVSDPLPTILQGIPLQLRSVRIAIDRDGFMVTPTSCTARAVDAAIAAGGGAVAHASSRYQVGGCGALKYTPKLSVRVGARGQTAAGKPTSLVATLSQPAGQAASRSVRLELPKQINARLEVVKKACTQAAYDAGNCGEAARIGVGSAVTSLLRDPLRGNAYFVRNPARTLPDIVVQLRGAVALDVVGKVTIKGNGQLITTFDTIPDVPLSLFRLSLPKANSPVGAVGGLCSHATRVATARQTLRAQSGKLLQRTTCG